MARRFRRRRSGRSMPSQVIQSYKKVLNYAPTSHAASTVINTPLSLGVDSVAAGQTGPTDASVPTGAIITSILIQCSLGNLADLVSFFNYTIQRKLSGQSNVSSILVGGNPLRNQIHKQGQVTMGQNQNRDITILFKVPKPYQRVREGATWDFNFIGNTIFTSTVQVIYKFYR